MAGKKGKKAFIVTVICSMAIVLAPPRQYSQIYAESKTATRDIKPEFDQVSWKQKAAINFGKTMNGEKPSYKAMADNGALLSQNPLGNGTTKYTRKDADAVANGFHNNLSYFTSAETSAFSSTNPSKMPLRSDLLKLTTGTGADQVLLSDFAKLNDVWWTGDAVVKEQPDNKIDPVVDTLGQRRVPTAYAVGAGNKINATGFKPSSRTYNCYINPPSDTIGTCNPLDLPGKVPLAPFDYDAGFKEKVETLSLSSEVPITALKVKGDASSYRQQVYIPDNPLTPGGDKKFIYYNATLTEINNKKYIFPQNIADAVATPVEFDYPQVEPSWSNPIPFNSVPTAFFIDYRTFKLYSVGSVIPAYTPLIYLSINKNPSGRPGNTSIPVNFVVYDQSMEVTTAVDKKTLKMPTTQAMRRTFHEIPTDLKNITPVNQAFVRPQINLNGNSIAFFKDASNTSERIDNEFNTVPVSEAKADGKEYKTVVKDVNQQVNDISLDKTYPDSNVIDYDAQTNTLYVKPGQDLTSVKFNIKTTNTSTGGKNYITGLFQKDRSPTGKKLSRLAEIGNQEGVKNTEITLDLSKLLSYNLETVGSAGTINLYVEQVNSENQTDYISKIPFTLNIVKISPQEIKLDDSIAGLRAVTYGDDILLTAKTSRAFFANTPITFRIDTSTDTQDIDAAEIKDVTWNIKNGIGIATAKLHLKDGLGGADGKITILLDKAGDSNYYKAKTLKLNLDVHKRAVTISPRLTLMKANDAYPPLFETNVILDKDIISNGLVDGDTIPYHVEVNHETTTGILGSPVVVDGKLTPENTDKKWGLTLLDNDSSSVIAFEKKYSVTKSDYSTGNGEAILAVMKNFRQIEESDIQQQLSDIENTALGSPAAFTFKFTFPLKDSSGKSLGDSPESAAQYQGLSYQWHRKDKDQDYFHDYTPTPGSGTSQSIEYATTDNPDIGLATVTLKIDSTDEIDNMSTYHAHFFNYANLNNDDRKVTRNVDFGIIQEPSTYVNVPASVKLSVNNSGRITNEGSSDSADNNNNRVSLSSINAGEYTPKGEFEIALSKPTVQLFLNGNTAITDMRKIYYMRVRTDSGYLDKTGKFMSLSYQTGHISESFLLTAPNDKSKYGGKYSGTMDFILTYKKP